LEEPRSLNEEEIQEFFDSPEELEEKIKTLANFVRESSYFVVYTGAGISTSAGIPDFRGPQGIWTLAAKNLPRTAPTVDKPVPTPTHMSLVSLIQHGYLKYLISTNCDGFHLKSGVPPSKMCELHGNSNVEACAVCGKSYWRPFRVRAVQKNKKDRSRLTGRDCECGGKLRSTTVAFNQSMPDLCLMEAERHSRFCDLSLVMGSSMRVTPACNLPLRGRKKKWSY